MLFYTTGQAQVFMAALYAGLLIGMWYDLCRLARWVLSAGRFITLAVDVVFGVGSACLLLGALLVANYGELRLYAFLGALCGAILYFGTLSPLIRWLLKGLGRMAGAAGRWLYAQKLVRKILK